MSIGAKLEVAFSVTRCAKTCPFLESFDPDPTLLLIQVTTTVARQIEVYWERMCQTPNANDQDYNV